MSSCFVRSLSTICLVFLSFSFSVATSPQLRDALTPEEVDRLRDVQQLDQRTDLFIKIADRRFRALTVAGAAASESAKDVQRFGAFPEGNRTVLLNSLNRIIDEAITNIDDVASRDERNPLLAKAIRKLAEAATRYQPQLIALRGQIKDEEELGALESTLKALETVLEAVKDLPAPAEEKSKRKKG